MNSDTKLTSGEFDAISHWSSYGQKGEPSKRRVKSDEWQAKPFTKPVTTPWDAIIPRKDVSKLLNGFCPSAMEDKWFVYADGPDAQGEANVHMHRSWTGHKMVELKIKLPLDADGEFEESDARVTALTWESDKENVGITSEEVGRDMAKETCQWVLDVNLKDVV